MESEVQGGPGAIGPNRSPPGAIPARMAVEAPEWDPPEPPRTGPNKTAVVVAGAALVIATGGMIRSMMSPTKAAPAPVAASPSYFSEQTRLMRDAMSMAREAQDMQQERMEMMRREMRMQEEVYGGGPSEGFGAIEAGMGMGDAGGN